MNWYARSKQLGRFRHISNTMKAYTFEMRDNPTLAENAFWQIVRSCKALGFKFRRQHVIGRFIADFYCHQASLVVEIDGSSHDNRAVEDQIRSQWLSNLGLRVVRFTNEQVLCDPSGVRRKLEVFLSGGPPADGR